MSRTSWAPYLCGLLIALMMLWFAAFNRFPLFNEDSKAYLQRPAMAMQAVFGPKFHSEWGDATAERKVEGWQAGNDFHDAGKEPEKAPSAAPASQETGRGWLSGRSIYYGLVTYPVIWLTGVWGGLLLQSFLTGSILALFWFRGLGQSSVKWCLLLGAFVAFGTSASVFSAFFTPDYLSGLLIAGVTLLAIAWRDLRLIDRIFLISTATFAVLSHDSHLALAIAMLAAMLLLRFLTRRAPRPSVPISAFVATGGVIAMGLAGAALFAVMSVKATGYRPLRLPFLTAHVVDMDEAADALKSICAKGAKFEACREAGRYPMSWIDFMFDRDPAVGVFSASDPARQRRLSDEQIGLVWALVKERPLGVPLAFAGDGLRQLAAFRYVDLDQRIKEPFFTANFPPHVLSGIEASRIWQTPQLLTWLSDIHGAIALVSLIALIPLAIAIIRRPRMRDHALLPAGFLILAGLLSNAIICGVLASPYDRFGARTIWLLPWLAAMSWAISRQKPEKDAEEQ